MRTFLRKLLTTGLPVAVVSGVLGYGLAGFAGTYADAQAALLRGNTDVPSERMKVRIPALLAGTSFAAIVVLEGLAALFRRNRPAAPPAPAPKPLAASESGLDAEVEALLNGILAQTEADRLAQTPPTTGSETSGGPRNLSTTH